MNDELISICKLLKYSKRIAVIGLSRNPDKISRIIAEFLIKKGYEVYGVNPNFNEADGIKVFPRLIDIPYDIDIVNVFRKSEDIPEIILDVIEKNPKSLWLQQGIRNDKAVQPVIEKGIFTVQDKCIMVYYNICKNSNLL
ncbi:MAG: CoA-binding protein [Melioribacter sp.]|uniref:CoA-binding protein n=1 Tax=Rosettibacter primus TaxID=3111523 RepID=UPI00247DCDC8|nr:CoA-binding protein [Melioribacter sp.]